MVHNPLATSRNQHHGQHHEPAKHCMISTDLSVAKDVPANNFLTPPLAV